MNMMKQEYLKIKERVDVIDNLIGTFEMNNDNLG
jgi:septal ring factor EnvC (AmiA/AmiB activator)